MERHTTIASSRIAILGRFPSKLRLISLNGEASVAVKISDERSHGILNIDGAVYSVTDEILKIHNDGKTTTLVKNTNNIALFSQVVSFQNKIYIIQPEGKKMMKFNPVDDSKIDDLPGCILNRGFCCCASDDLIFAMGGWSTENSALKYDPVKNRWTDIVPMKYKRNASASAAFGGRIYVVGGKGDPPPEFYDPQSECWSEIPRTNVHRMWFCLCVINDQLFAVGGDREKGSNELIENTIEVYDGNQWKIVKKFDVNAQRIYACLWPFDSGELELQEDFIRLEHLGIKEIAHGDTIAEEIDDETNQTLAEHTSKQANHQAEQLTKEICEEINQHISEHIPTKAQIIGQNGGTIQLPGTAIKIPDGAIETEEQISFSTRTVVEQEDGLIDIAQRLQTESPVEFANPVSVKMETTVSAPVGESIPLTLHQRESPDKEWKEIAQLSVGERNEVDFKIHQRGETKITINFKEWRRLASKKIRKFAKGMVNQFRMKVHAREDFYINRETGLVVATFSKDQNTQHVTEQKLCCRGYAPFSISPHQFTAYMRTKVTPNVICEAPKGNEIKDEVCPSPCFMVDEDFLVQGSRCVYFSFARDLTNICQRIRLMYECMLDGELDHKLPLSTRWPLEVRREGRIDNTIEETRKKTVVIHQTNKYEFHAPVGQVAMGGAKIINQGDINYHFEDSQSTGPEDFDHKTSDDVQSSSANQNKTEPDAHERMSPDDVIRRPKSTPT